MAPRDGTVTMSNDPDSAHALRLPTLRDLIAPLFRHKVAGLLTAVAVFTVTIVVVLRSPSEYEAEMKILVKRERVDPIVSADRNVVQQGRSDVTEDELNSEVELIKSRDLLEEVALASGLYAPNGRPGGAGQSPDRAAISHIVRRLQANIKVAPVKRTTLIRVTYRSSDPALAARVPAELARLYLEKHQTLHRSPGAYQFFTKQVERFQAELAESERQWKEYGRQGDVVSADIEKANALQKLSDFEATLQQTRGGIADSNHRIAELEAQIAATPSRQTTQVRTSENAGLVGQLKSRTLDLEVRQADMLRKFAPTYPPVVEIGQQLAQARAALDSAEQAPLTEETTDQDPTHQWLRGELARVRTERVALMARGAAIADSVREYRTKARQLDEKGTAQQDLTRAMKSAEENYLLYRRKQEEARISDALDRTRISNVAIAEAPTVPALPSSSGGSWILKLGAILSVLIGIGTTYLLHYISPYFRTPEEVERSLGIPVLTSLPGAR
jgi:uncharacterized protein involved in exopolysaccharide biosynthesis